MARHPTVLLLLALLAAAGAAAAGASPGSGGAPVEAVLVLEEPLDSGLAEALRARGLTGLEAYDVAEAVGVRASPDQLEAAVRLDGVQDAYRSQALETNLDESRAAVEADGPYEDRGLGGTNVTVAVVDSGIDADHPAFGDRVQAGRSFDASGAHRSRQDTEGHGTHIAGIVAGSGAESQDRRLRGIAPEAGLVGLDISDPFTTKNALRAFEWVHDHHEEEGIRIVTNSWGRADDEARYDPDDPLIRASNGLVQDGLVVVFSSGNKGPDEASLTVEAMNPNVLAVGATDTDGLVASYSSRGPARGQDGEALPWVKPDLVAPGTRIDSARTQDADDGVGPPTGTGEDRYYVTMNGTSMAAPHVAGTAALLLDRRPTLTPKAVEAILQASATDRGADGPDPAYGHGLVNARTALRTLALAEEGKVVVETRQRVPVEDEGEATGAQGSVVASGAQLHAPPEDGVRSGFEVPARSPSANLSFSWEDERTSFEVTLEHGSESVGPFHPDPGRTTVWANVTVPEEGDWTLRAEPREPTDTGWTVGGHVTVLETRVVEGADGVLDQGDGWSGDGGFFEDGSDGDGVLEVLGGIVGVPGDPLAGLAVAASALGGVLLRVRD